MQYTFNENHIWPEERIRQVFRHLDEATGLDGASLPIQFTCKVHCLGSFYPMEGGTGRFEFSRAYLEDPGTPEEVNLDTIRHEYAHYMDWVMYGNSGHSLTWKNCCSQINALPIRCYNPKMSQHYRKIHDRREANTRLCADYTAGRTIVHSIYGTGVIRKVHDVKEDRLLEIDFEDGHTRKLSARWLHDHCEGRCVSE
ncbi:MAG: SprT-like domain-containing protein [Clostridia bacterium]|nr:SprT-like domain-containing protein [Clostridia bacterium]